MPKQPLSPLFGINDRPPAATSALAGLQHLLAVIGGILTAPLIIALGMGLPPAETSYLLTSALLISGIATLIQISRVGPVGSGLLSVQGTSFTFIGPILFAFYSLPDAMTADQKLAAVFGSCMLASAVMMVVSCQVQKLERIFTKTVTGVTVVLLGITLVWTTLKSLFGEVQSAPNSFESGWLLILALGVFAMTFAMATSKNSWVRLSSISAGLVIGFFVSLVFGKVDFSTLSQLENTFLPIPFRFGIGFDWGVFFILLPVFIVSATESIGDLTATCALSRLETSGKDYWQRIRGGILGDSMNSVFAGLFATFPNTTFSQNNGVIRLTGISSRRVGYVVAVLLAVLGFFPIVSGVFQIIPSVVIYASTLLMFSLVGLAGWNILKSGDRTVRSWSIAVIAILGGWSISLLIKNLDFLPEQVGMILQFPVSTGAFLAMLLELLVPKGAGNSVAEK